MSADAGLRPRAEVSEPVVRKFPGLFGTKAVDDQRIGVEETIRAISDALDEEIAQVLTKRRELLVSTARVAEKYRFPAWEDTFEDPVSGQPRTFREIVQGLLDNFLGRRTPLAWRLNDGVPIPDDAHPLKNPGLELTGPWHPIEMAIKQLNADVAAVMGPDNEDAAPADYLPFGAPPDRPVALFASRDNERRILSGAVHEATTSRREPGKTYRIEKPREQWPTSFHRVPGIHLRTPHVTVDRRPAASIIVDYVIHALNDYGSLRAAGRGLYFYQPKVQNPSEARVVAELVWTLEQLLGARRPGTRIKFKALFEEGNLGRFLPVAMWMWRYWLIGTNVGRWDYTGSLIEMWKDERVLPDPQSGPRMGMAAPHMMVYQRYNALLNVMAGMSEAQLTHAAPIGGMAAVMLYLETDPYRRDRHNPVTLRAMKMDKLRERLIGLIFVPDDGEAPRAPVPLAEILAHRVAGRLFDAYRQSWVASPNEEYVAAGNAPLRVRLEDLQAMLDAPVVWEIADQAPIAPKVASGLTPEERELLTALGLLNESGRITPWVVRRERIDAPDRLLSASLWGAHDLWSSLYDIPEGEITAENVQHALYMAANYGFQLLNGNLAAAIDDYAIVPHRVVRFMNDAATYRIFVGWLWTVVHHEARITRHGWFSRPRRTEDGVFPAEGAIELKAGTPITRELFERLWDLHNAWTRAFFEDLDRLAALRLLAVSIVDPKRKDAKGPDRDPRVERLVQWMVAILGEPRPPREAANALAAALGLDPAIVAAGFPSLDRVDQIRPILSRAYGPGHDEGGQLTHEEAAARISALLGIDRSTALSEVRAGAPRFDRSKAPVIMDVLKRQLLSSLYLQHSPRVLFAIADKTDEQRAHILNAVYYVDEEGRPLFRDASGQPSRAQLVNAVEHRQLPTYALEVHDYVYDVFPSLPA